MKPKKKRQTKKISASKSAVKSKSKTTSKKKAKKLKRPESWRKNLITAKTGKLQSPPSKMRALRTKKGLPQRDLINPKSKQCILTISRIERKISPVDSQHAKFIADRLKTSVNNIFKKVGDNRYLAK